MYINKMNECYTNSGMDMWKMRMSKEQTYQKQT